MAYWLTVRGSPPFELREGVDVTIGRGQSCDLCLYSSMLSREHARVRWENGRPVLFDLESLNGTFVGLDRIARHSLRDGDVVRLGDITLLVRVSDGPPAAAASEQASRDEDTNPAAPAPEFEPTNETRIYSRTAVLHQKVFEYDEIGWLRQRLGPREELLGLPSAGADDLAAWFREAGRDEALLWELLQLGILRPVDARRGLRGLPLDEVLRGCALTKRAEKLRLQLSGQRAIWNEMAALRYQVRQGKLFKPLRMIARAYRPGRGLAEVDLARMVYELTSIYAPDVSRAALDAELRRLQALGFVGPRPGARAEAWFPDDWSGGACDLTPRGRAMLEGFRLEE